MFYTEITEQTYKTVRFRGIYGLYVNKSIKKTNKFQFGYWRPRVRVPPLRPLRNHSNLLIRFEFFILCLLRTRTRSAVLRRLDFIVIIRRFASLRSSNSLKSSGASRKTVSNCFSLAYPPLRPKNSRKQAIFDLFSAFFYTFCTILTISW